VLMPSSSRSRAIQSGAHQRSGKKRTQSTLFFGCLFPPTKEASMAEAEASPKPKTVLEARIRGALEQYKDDIQHQSCFKRTTSSSRINKSRSAIIYTLEELVNSDKYHNFTKAEADRKLFNLFCKLFGGLEYDTPERGKRAWIRRALRGDPRLPNYMQVILDDVNSGDIKLNIANDAQTRVDVFFDVLIALLENDYRKSTAGYVINCIRDALPEISCKYHEAVEVDAGPTVRSIQSHGRQIFYKRIPFQDVKDLLLGFRLRSSSNSEVIQVFEKSCKSDCYLEMAAICFKYMKRAFDVNPLAGIAGEDVYVEQFEAAFSSYNRVDPKRLVAGRYHHSASSRSVVSSILALYGSLSADSSQNPGFVKSSGR
jgi:hypothetical protein